MAKRYSLRSRLGYRFDNLMSQGTSAKLKLLLVATILYIVVMGLVSAFVVPRNDADAPKAFWNTAMYVIGKGSPALGDGPLLFTFLSLLSVFYCLFFTAVLIGLITQGIRSKMDSIAKGTGKVLEEGHVLILGYNDATLVLLGQLIEANRNQPKQQRIVVLDEIDWKETTDAIRLRFGTTRNHPQTKIMCRTGAIFGFDDLRRCSLETARVVIVNGDNDFDAVRAIIACTHLLKSSQEEHLPYLVSVIHDDENIAESSVAIEHAGMAGILEYLPLNDTLARIMVHTSRQPGLSDVFTELFNYEDDEFYIVDDDASFPRLYGRSIAEINLMLKASYAVGTYNKSNGVTIAAPNAVVFKEGDSLIVAKEDDDPLVVAKEPVRVNVMPVDDAPAVRPVDVLILGARPMLDSIIEEYANYLHAGSSVHIADFAANLQGAVREATRLLLEGEGVSIQEHALDYAKGDELARLLDECDPDSVLVLIDHSAPDLDADDERTVRVLVYLREYRHRNNKNFSITSEIHRGLNKDLVSITGPDDFIIGGHIAALLMAQISARREMAAVFQELLSSEGFEIYLKKALRYVPIDQPIDLHTVSQAVADKDEVFIGFRRKRQGSYEIAEVNPSKYVSDMSTLRKYKFSDDDYFVVLASQDDAEDMSLDCEG